MDEYVKAVVNADTSREALIGKLANVLCNAMNFPPKVAPHILGQNMMPLMSLVADVVIARDRVVAANAWDEAIAAAQSLGDAIGHYQVTLKSPINPYRITEENN